MGMSAGVHRVAVQEAYADRLNLTLSRVCCDLGRLIYLASTRDSNTGNNYHEGLVGRFNPEVARKALEIAHRQAFYKVSAFSLEDLVGDLEAYMRSTRENPQEFFRAWQKLEPYPVALPTEVNLTVARLFMSNVRLALAILRFRQEPSHSRR